MSRTLGAGQSKHTQSPPNVPRARSRHRAWWETVENPKLELVRLPFGMRLEKSGRLVQAFRVDMFPRALPSSILLWVPAALNQLQTVDALTLLNQPVNAFGVYSSRLSFLFDSVWAFLMY
jgi:hypothetical protein